MNITGGTLKGRKLFTLKGKDLRPTPQIVRSAMFNILGKKVEGANFADLCAGSGSVGLEAISRGAKFCVFVENNPEAVRVIKRNLDSCGVSEKAVVIAKDVFSCLKVLSRHDLLFNIVFIDPPYRFYQNKIRRLQNMLGSFAENLCCPDAIIIVQRPAKLSAPLKLVHGLTKTRRFGDTCLDFYCG